MRKLYQGQRHLPEVGEKERERLGQNGQEQGQWDDRDGDGDEDGDKMGNGCGIGQGRQDGKQKSLHSFWSLPASASTHLPRNVNTANPSTTTRCEDCDAPLHALSQTSNLKSVANTNGDGDYDMLDANDTSIDLQDQAHAGGGVCDGCGKIVCGLCSSVPRSRRGCLECVGRGVV